MPRQVLTRHVADRTLAPFMPVRVKICGITNLEDARAAVEFGADALGFIFYGGSPRCIAPEAAREIIAELPPFVARVGVFVDTGRDDLLKIAGTAGIDTIQLHGKEPPEFCEEVSAAGFKIIKAVRVKDAASIEDLARYQVSAFLLDSYVPGQLGGTGAVFNWDVALGAKRFGKPVILAGGLTPENVGSAVESVRPYAVDVSSGVEIKAGRKDHEKVRLFIERCKRADGSLPPVNVL